MLRLQISSTANTIIYKKNLHRNKHLLKKCSSTFSNKKITAIYKKEPYSWKSKQGSYTHFLWPLALMGADIIGGSIYDPCPIDLGAERGLTIKD